MCLESTEALESVIRALADSVDRLRADVVAQLKANASMLGDDFDALFSANAETIGVLGDKLVRELRSKK